MLNPFAKQKRETNIIEWHISLNPSSLSQSLSVSKVFDTGISSTILKRHVTCHKIRHNAHACSLKCTQIFFKFSIFSPCFAGKGSHKRYVHVQYLWSKNTIKQKNKSDLIHVTDGAVCMIRYLMLCTRVHCLLDNS